MELGLVFTGLPPDVGADEILREIIESPGCPFKTTDMYAPSCSVTFGGRTDFVIKFASGVDLGNLNAWRQRFTNCLWLSAYNRHIHFDADEEARFRAFIRKYKGGTFFFPGSNDGDMLRRYPELAQKYPNVFNE